MKTIKMHAPLAALAALFLVVGLSSFASALPATHSAARATAQAQQQQPPASQ